MMRTELKSIRCGVCIWHARTNLNSLKISRYIAQRRIPSWFAHAIENYLLCDRMHLTLAMMRAVAQNFVRVIEQHRMLRRKNPKRRNMHPEKMRTNCYFFLDIDFW
jgi:hypothetical protein